MPQCFELDLGGCLSGRLIELQLTDRPSEWTGHLLAAWVTCPARSQLVRAIPFEHEPNKERGEQIGSAEEGRVVRGVKENTDRVQ